jgi:predicted secreted protein
MNWLAYVATFFIFWWLILFAVMPFGLKTQEDDQNVTLGTVASAPRGPHMLRAMLWTTLLTLLLVGAIYLVVDILNLGVDDLPHIVPDFSSPS